MTIRLNDAAKNAILDSGFDAVFNDGTLEIRSGPQPAAASDAASGTLLASITLPADAFAAASSGAKAKSGTWSDASADAAGTAGWFRMKNSGDTARLDGSVTATGAGGDLTLDNTSIASAQAVTINSFSVSL
jgi:hypothetical protein